ncbi:MAG: TIGR03621 family F420-dependent LLM class oxidoreductase [Actinobacteria bacterium]|nr:TIGR03621 family F420-dependent LLM class oxidoreductase [Actinomycetota bacterium]
MRGFRFGVQGSPAPTEPAWADAARRAEDHGYHVLSMPDHLDGTLAPLVALGYAAALTERIHLGTTVLAADFRNPAVLADEVTTLDELARHRFELGLGAGWRAADYDTAGIPFAPAGARIARLGEVAAAVRGGVRPDLPLLLGGGGRRMLTVAAQVADIVGIVTENPGGVAGGLAESGTLAATREKVGWIREAAGDRFAHLELNVRVWATEADAAGSLGSEAADSPHVMAPTATTMADKLLRLRDETGISYVTVSVRFLDEFAPVIDLLADR